MALAASTQPVVSALSGRDTELSDLGNYFVGVSPTIGTGNIGTASVQAFTETTPVLIVYNSGLLNIYPMYWKMHSTVIGTTAPTIALMFTFTLDTGNRLSSAGTLLTISNTNMNSAVTSGAVISSGAPIATAATGVRRVVGHAAMEGNSVTPVHATHTFIWGSSGSAAHTVLIDNTTTIGHHARTLAPCVIGPGQSMVVVRWSPAIVNAPTLEHEFQFVEK